MLIIMIAMMLCLKCVCEVQETVHARHHYEHCDNIIIMQIIKIKCQCYVRTSSIWKANIRELPNVAKPHGIAKTGQDELGRVVPLSALRLLTSLCSSEVGRCDGGLHGKCTNKECYHAVSIFLYRSSSGTTVINFICSISKSTLNKRPVATATGQFESGTLTFYIIGCPSIPYMHAFIEGLAVSINEQGRHCFYPYPCRQSSQNRQRHRMRLNVPFMTTSYGN